MNLAGSILQNNFAKCDAVFGEGSLGENLVVERDGMWI